MLTQARVRRGFYCGGVCIGAAALVGYLMSLGGAFALGSARRSVVFGRGAAAAYWLTDGRNSGVQGPLDPLRFNPLGWHVLPRWHVPERGGTWNIAEFVVPYWVPLVFGLWCGFRLLPEGPARGLCAKCGYDLSAVPRKEGKVTCPECGTKA